MTGWRWGEVIIGRGDYKWQFITVVKQETFDFNL